MHSQTAQEIMLTLTQDPVWKVEVGRLWSTVTARVAHKRSVISTLIRWSTAMIVADPRADAVLDVLDSSKR